MTASTHYPDLTLDPLMDSGGSSGPMTKTNQRLGYLLIAILVFAPIPLGSNRPVFWALWATIAAAILLWYSLTLHVKHSRPRIALHRVRGVLTLFGIVSCLMVIQILPLGTVLGPFEFTSQTGAVISSKTLSLSPGDTWLALLRWLTYGIIFYLALQVCIRRQRARQLYKAIIVITTIQAAYALLALTQLGDLLLFLPKQYYAGSATGTFVNRNSLATFLNIGVILSFALLTRPSSQPISSSNRRRRNRKHVDLTRLKNLISFEKTLFAIALICLLIGLIATESRVGLFSGLAGLGLIVILRGATMRQAKKNIGVMVVGTIGLVGLLVASLSGRFIAVLKDGALPGDLYRQIFEMIGDRPLLGFGAHSFAHAFPLYHDLGLRTDRIWDNAHSSYLANWTELGVIVGSAPLLIVLLLTSPLIRAIFSKDTVRTEVIAALALTFTIALHASIDFSMEMEAVVLTYLAVMASALAFHLYDGKQSARAASHAPQDKRRKREINASKQTDGAASSESGSTKQNSSPSFRPRLQFPALPAVTYAVGDIHGRLDLLQKLEAKIAADAEPFVGEKWLVILGDFVDRGPQSAQVIEYLINHKIPGFKRFCIAGNHEVMMQAFVHQVDGSKDWLGFGGSETLRSYGMSERDIEQVAKGGQSAEYLLSSHIPEDHISFLETLPDSLITPECVFVHIAPGDPSYLPGNVDFTNALEDEFGAQNQHVLTVHGHVVVPKPIQVGSRINVDTGAYETGCLSAVRILPDRSIQFIDSLDK